MHDVVLHDVVDTEPTVRLSGVLRIAVPTTAPPAPLVPTTSWTTVAPVAAPAGTANVALPAPTPLGAITPTVVPV